jgi:hypothetical protein
VLQRFFLPKPRFYLTYKEFFMKAAMGTIWSISLWTVVATAGAVDDFSDITYWVGSGANQAALVIDWDGDDATNHSLVWGFRWDGSATSEDLLRAVVLGDPRLFAKISGPTSFGIGIFGIGYDLDGDTNFGISDGTVFPAGGLVVADPDDTAVATDPGDLYREGFFSGFWNFGLSVGNPYSGGAWASAQTGVSGETLAHGDWNSLAFTVTFADVFASHPQSAAVPETSTLILVAGALTAVVANRFRNRS